MNLRTAAFSSLIATSKVLLSFGSPSQISPKKLDDLEAANRDDESKYLEIK